MSFDDDESGQLTLGDRLNYPYILSKGFLTFLQSIANGGFSEQEVIEGALALKSIISTHLQDEQYKKAIEAAIYVAYEDRRPLWCGVRTGKELLTPIRRYNYYALVQAGVDLLYRKGMMSRRIPTERKANFRPEIQEDEDEI